jgi:hypothetical protein
MFHLLYLETNCIVDAVGHTLCQLYTASLHSRQKPRSIEIKYITLIKGRAFLSHLWVTGEKCLTK